MKKQQAEAVTSVSVLKEDLGSMKKQQHDVSSSCTVMQDDISSMKKQQDEVNASVHSKINILQQKIHQVEQLSG